MDQNKLIYIDITVGWSVHVCVRECVCVCVCYFGHYGYLKCYGSDKETPKRIIKTKPLQHIIDLFIDLISFRPVLSDGLGVLGVRD